MKGSLRFQERAHLLTLVIVLSLFSPGYSFSAGLPVRASFPLSQKVVSPRRRMSNFAFFEVARQNALASFIMLFKAPVSMFEFFLSEVTAKIVEQLKQAQAIYDSLFKRRLALRFASVDDSIDVDAHLYKHPH
jgi:hypothetical protein